MDTKTTEQSPWDRICDSYKAEYTRGYDDGKADANTETSPVDLFVATIRERHQAEIAADDDGSEHPYWELDSELKALALKAIAHGDLADEAYDILERADLIAHGDRVILDARYAGLSRSKIWCGRGRRAPFRPRAQITENGYAEIPAPAPAKREVWTQNSSDGFKRSERTQWRVESLTVAGILLTVARRI